MATDTRTRTSPACAWLRSGRRGVADQAPCAPSPGRLHTGASARARSEQTRATRGIERARCPPRRQSSEESTLTELFVCSHSTAGGTPAARADRGTPPHPGTGRSATHRRPALRPRPRRRLPRPPVELGISQRGVQIERDAWIPVHSATQDQAAVLVAQKRAALADPEFRAIYLQFDAALDWPPDDPRLEPLAARLNQVDGQPVGEARVRPRQRRPTPGPRPNTGNLGP
jgi:hypothetical protein